MVSKNVYMSTNRSALTIVVCRQNSDTLSWLEKEKGIYYFNNSKYHNQ